MNDRQQTIIAVQFTAFVSYRQARRRIRQETDPQFIKMWLWQMRDAVITYRAAEELAR